MARPDERIHRYRLEVAVAVAQIELEQFAEEIARALPAGYEADARLVSRTMAGLGQLNATLPF
jgi:hypothetical protein